MIPRAMHVGRRAMRSLRLVGLWAVMLSGPAPRAWEGWPPEHRPGMWAAALPANVALRHQGLHFPGGQAAFAPVFARMDSLLLAGVGTLRVVHMGGSHVQAGWISDQIRQRWEQLAPGTQPDAGLILPHRLVRTNTSARIELSGSEHWSGARCGVRQHEGPFGATGVRAETGDAGARWVQSCSGPDGRLQQSDRVTIYGTAQGLEPVWDGPPATARRLPHPAGWTFHFDPPVDTLRFRWDPVPAPAPDSIPDSVPPRARVHGWNCALTSAPAHFVYHDLGNNGAATYSYLRDGFSPDFLAQWADLSPDLVVLGIGINDAHGDPDKFDVAAFEARYDSLLNGIRLAQPGAAFLFLTNTDSRYQGRPNRNALAVREAMFRLAARHGAAVFDLFDAMGGLGSFRRWQQLDWAQDDGIHLNAAGYRIVGNLLFDAWLNAWGRQAHADHRKRYFLPPSLTPGP